MLTQTGSGVSGILALNPNSFQIEASLVTIVTLKRRKTSTLGSGVAEALMPRYHPTNNVRRGAPASLRAMTAYCRKGTQRLFPQFDFIVLMLST